MKRHTSYFYNELLEYHCLWCATGICSWFASISFIY